MKQAKNVGIAFCITFVLLTVLRILTDDATPTGIAVKIMWIASASIAFILGAVDIIVNRN